MAGIPSLKIRNSHRNDITKKREKRGRGRGDHEHIVVPNVKVQDFNAKIYCTSNKLPVSHTGLSRKPNICGWQYLSPGANLSLAVAPTGSSSFSTVGPPFGMVGRFSHELSRPWRITWMTPAAVRCLDHRRRAHRKNRQFRIERVFHPTEKKSSWWHYYRWWRRRRRRGGKSLL